jgi:hypothetical protein
MAFEIGKKQLNPLNKQIVKNVEPLPNTVQHSNNDSSLTSQAQSANEGLNHVAVQVNAANSNNALVSLPGSKSCPDPADLRNKFYGQKGELSPNQTGHINNAAQLAQFVYAGYNNGSYGPISIVPVTIHEADSQNKAYLVGLSGTEMVKNQSTGIFTDLKVGFERDNHYLRNVRESILKTVPEGSNLILAGHSLGGMVAQQLAADPELKSKYTIISTVAFGSPLVGLGKREGKVHRITAFGDPVPRLSVGSALPPGSIWSWFGQQNVRSSTALDPFKTHVQEYTNESNKRLIETDALGTRNGKAVIKFDPSERIFFRSIIK